MSNKVYTQDDINKIKQIVAEGGKILQEVADLRESLNDTVKAIAEELELKPAVLKKVIKVAFDQTLEEERAKFTELEDILDAIGKGS